MKKRSTILLFIFTIIITYSINVSAVECTGVFTTDIINKMDQYVYKPIKWATPILLLVLTSLDFAKVVFSGDQKGMSKATSNFLKRAVAALIIFFAPDIINLLVTFINQQSISSCMQGNFK